MPLLLTLQEMLPIILVTILETKHQYIVTFLFNREIRYNFKQKLFLIIIINNFMYVNRVLETSRLKRFNHYRQS